MIPLLAGGMAGAGAMGAGAVGSALDYAKQRRLMQKQADINRGLRQTEYGDMVTSLKDAGLNPMMAFGGQSPTSASVGQPGGTGGSSAMSASLERSLRSKTVDPQSELIKQQKKLLGFQTNSAEEKAKTDALFNKLQRINIQEELNMGPGFQRNKVVTKDKSSMISGIGTLATEVVKTLMANSAKNAAESRNFKYKDPSKIKLYGFPKKPGVIKRKSWQREGLK